MNKILDKASFDIEDFLDEIILVQFKTGVYFTAKGSGPAILRVFKDSLAIDTLNEAISERFGEEKSKEVSRFLEQLVKEGILIDSDSTMTQAPEFPAEAFAEPIVFQKFDDMSDLIKLDPIHDVSDLGWPHKKQE